MKLATTAILLIFCVLNAASAATPSKCHITFRTAVNESPPLYFNAEPGKKAEGVTIDIINELKIRTGCNFNITPMNRSKTSQMLEYSQIDLAIIETRNQIFDKYARFIPVKTAHREFIVKQSEISSDTTPEQLLKDPKYKFLTLPRYRMFFKPDEQEKLDQENRFVTGPTVAQLFEKLKTGKNLVLVFHPVVSYYLKDSPEFKRLQDKENSFEIGAYYIPRRGQEKGIELISQALLNLVKDGTWAKIMEKQRP